MQDRTRLRPASSLKLALFRRTGGFLFPDGWPPLKTDQWLFCTGLRHPAGDVALACRLIQDVSGDGVAAKAHLLKQLTSLPVRFRLPVEPKQSISMAITA